MLKFRYNPFTIAIKIENPHNNFRKNTKTSQFSTKLFSLSRHSKYPAPFKCTPSIEYFEFICPSNSNEE